MSHWPYPRIAAHRGGGTLAPENTLTAVDTGIQYGFRMVEFDAKLAVDGTVFLLHDDTVDRTSDGEGLARRMTYPELFALDAGSWFSEQFAGEHMPTLGQVAHRCIHHSVAANIEIKPCEGRDAPTGTRVAAAAAVLWEESPVAPLLSSFSYPALHAAMLEAPHLPRGMLYEQVPDDWHEQALSLRSVSVHASHRYLNAALVAQIKSAGLRVLAYTVNEPARARELAAWGVDTICTDRLDDIGPHFLDNA